MAWTWRGHGVGMAWKRCARKVNCRARAEASAECSWQGGHTASASPPLPRYVPLRHRPAKHTSAAGNACPPISKISPRRACGKQHGFSPSEIAHGALPMGSRVACALRVHRVSIACELRMCKGSAWVCGGRAHSLKSCTARSASVPHRWRPTSSTGAPCERKARHRLRRSEAVLRSHRDETSRMGQPSACRCSGLRFCGPGVTVCGAHWTSTSTIFCTLSGGSSSESSIDR